MTTPQLSLAAAHAALETASNDDAARWRELLAEVGVDISSPLTSALERVHALTTTGRIDRVGLRALREELDSARAAGMLAQQMARLASGRLRQSHEKLALSDLLSSVLTHRTRETQARGIVLKPRLKAVEVIADGSLLFSLLNAVLDWALRHARSEIDFHVDVKAWPAHARLVCRFAFVPPDQLDDGAGQASRATLDSPVWRLVEQTAWSMGLVLERRDGDGVTQMTVEFPRTVLPGVPAEMGGVSAIELDQGFATSNNSKPLAGSQVLVVASRRDVRTQVREAIKDMGLIIDMVASVDEAFDFCREGLPHAIIVEGVLSGERLRQLKSEITAEVPGFVFIEVVEEGTAFQMSGTRGAKSASVGRGAIETALPSVLMFELSKGL